MTTPQDDQTTSASSATTLDLTSVSRAASAYDVDDTQRRADTPPPRRIFVSADWVNVEGRLMAYFSGDPVLTEELENELRGGLKVHSLNAALIYGCKPEEAKTFMVNLKGTQRPAYEGGKRFTHMFNYGGGEGQMAETFWIPRAFARGVIQKLTRKYAGVVAYREHIADQVFGVVRFRCVSCGAEDTGPVKCETCSKGRAWPVLMQRSVQSTGAGEFRTPFNRSRLYPGPREKGAKPLASQPAQGSGASMWNYSLLALLGWDVDSMRALEVPKGAMRFNPFKPVSYMLEPWEIAPVGGTYDSFNIECNEDRRDEVAAWVKATLEKPWPQLQDKVFPAEVSWGYNLSKQTEENPDGLREL